MIIVIKKGFQGTNDCLLKLRWPLIGRSPLDGKLCLLVCDYYSHIGFKHLGYTLRWYLRKLIGTFGSKWSIGNWRIDVK